MQTIVLSKAAVEQVHIFRSDEPKYANLDLRVYIEGKNCDGFSYGVTFDERREGDLRIPYEGFDVLVDKESEILLKGTKIDWVDDDRGRGFDVKNPNQKSFRGKFYKRKAWRDYFEKEKPASE